MATAGRPTLAFLAVALLGAVGCAGPAIDPVASVSRSEAGRFEIEIRAVVSVYGGPCSLPRLIPERVGVSHWIYCESLESRIDASNLILTYERGKVAYPWPQSALKGSVTFSEGRMRVDLQTPHYRQDSTIAHYHAYSYNGSYTLESRAP